MSSCDSWSGSQGICAALGANLPSIHSQEVNVYVQSLHGGEHSWLGLSDINTEGTFVWSDGTPFDFHYWAKHQPNNFHNEDCVHTLGLFHNSKYKWNDVNCTDCHRFTCKKGKGFLIITESSKYNRSDTYYDDFATFFGQNCVTIWTHYLTSYPIYSYKRKVNVWKELFWLKDQQIVISFLAIF